jgi:hypothetical protein
VPKPLSPHSPECRLSRPELPQDPNFPKELTAKKGITSPSTYLSKLEPPQTPWPPQDVTKPLWSSPPVGHTQSPRLPQPYSGQLARIFQGHPHQTVSRHNPVQKEDTAREKTPAKQGIPGREIGRRADLDVIDSHLAELAELSRILKPLLLRCQLSRQQLPGSRGGRFSLASHSRALSAQTHMGAHLRRRT